MQKITILKGEMARKVQDDDKHIAEVEKEHKDELSKTESHFKSQIEEHKKELNSVQESYKSATHHHVELQS